MLTTTGEGVAGYRVARNLGVVRGLVVRSCSLWGDFMASFQVLFGGNITRYTEMCEQARREAFELMVRNAEKLGANAVIGIFYDSGVVMPACSEVLAYGTAVVVEPE